MSVHSMGLVWCYVFRFTVILLCLIWFEVVWVDSIWFLLIQFNSLWFVSIWVDSDSSWFDRMYVDSLWVDPVCFDVIQFDFIHVCSVGCDLMCFAVVGFTWWVSLAWAGDCFRVPGLTLFLELISLVSLGMIEPWPECQPEKSRPGFEFICART